MFRFQQMRRLRTSVQSFLYIARVKKFVFELRNVRKSGSDRPPPPVLRRAKRKLLTRSVSSNTLKLVAVKSTGARWRTISRETRKGRLNLERCANYRALACNRVATRSVTRVE